MKKILYVILLVLFFISSFAEEKDSVLYNNQISLELIDITNGTLHLKYERKVGENISLGISAGYKTKQGFVYLSGIDTEHIKTSDLYYNGFKVVPEIRYYLKKTQQYNLDGFYFGAYLKYSHYNSDLFGTFINKEGQDYRIDANAKLNITSLGLQVGYKLAISERFNIDFIIVGPGTSYHNYSLHNNTELPDEFYDDLTEALKKYSLYDLLNSDFEFNIKKARANFMMPTFRYGISIGYTF